MSRSYIAGRATVALLCGLFLAGCESIIYSTPPTADGTAPDVTKLGQYYVLPRGFVTIKLVHEKPPLVPGREYYLTMDDPIYRPDPAHYYRLLAALSTTADDEITIQTTPEGFLSSIASTSTDQSLAIVQKLIELATQVALIGVGPPVGFDRTVPTVPTITTLVRREVDLANCMDLNALQTDIRAKVGDQTIALSVKRPKLTSSLDGGDTVEEILPCPAPQPWSAPARCQAGVCFRPLIPYTLLVKGTGGKNMPDQQFVVLLPNDAPLLTVDIRRAPFVQKTADYTFDPKGTVTKTHVKKPSEAVGFVSIPIEVAKAIVSIPSAMLDFKVTTINKEKGVAEAQKQLLDAQKQLLDAQNALIEALKKNTKQP